MHRGAVPLAYVLLCSLVLVQPAGGQAPATPPSPKEPLVAFLDTVARPAAEGKALADETLRSFYNTYLPVETRAQVSEDQFTDYWKQIAAHPGQPAGYVKALKYSVGEPVQSEAHDQALIPTLLTAEYNPTAGHQIFGVLVSIVGLAGCLFFVPCLVLAKGRDPVISPPGYSPQSYRNPAWVAYHAVTEGGMWRLALPDSIIADMRRVTPNPAAKRYAPNTTVSDGGVTARVVEVILEKDTTAVRLSVENAGTDDARLLDALSLATLTDESGNARNVRILRSTLPERVAAGASVAAILVFDPVPLTAQKLSLSVPDIGTGERRMSLKLDMALTPPLPPVVSRTPIPGEPVLMYLLAIYDPLSVTVAKGVISHGSRLGNALKEFYQTYLSSETRSQVTENEFVDYGQKDVDARWRHKKAPFGSFKGFAIGEPVYNTTKDVASLQVTDAFEDHPFLGPVITKTEITTFHVAREGSVWKLVLSEEAVKNITGLRPAPPSVAGRHRFRNAETSNESVTIRVDDAVADKGFVTLHLIVKNDNDAEAYLLDMISAATLTDERGKTYATRILRSTLPEKVAARSSVEGNLVFEGAPVDSKKWQLTAPDLRVGDRVFTLSMDLPLEP